MKAYYRQVNMILFYMDSIIVRMCLFINALF